MKAEVKRVDAKPRYNQYSYKIMIDGIGTPFIFSVKSKYGEMYIKLEVVGQHISRTYKTPGVISGFEDWFEEHWPELRYWLMDELDKTIIRCNKQLEFLQGDDQ